MKTVETSIIIRTYNEGRHLARLLDAVLSQNYRDWEMILVDSGSTDDTLEIAKKYPVKVVSIPKEDFSFGYSLNTGCRYALGSYLVLVSAHTYPLNNKWLGNMVKPFEDWRVGMVYGRQIGNEVTKVSEAKDMLHNFGEKSKILVEESFGNNANAAIRKSLWSEIPYDETLPGIEDIDWAHKIQKRGFYVYYMADAVIYHIHDETYGQIYNRFKRESIAYRTIFPDYIFDAGKTAVVYTLAVLRDIYFGFTKKMPFGKILTAVPYRIAEYRGWRDGYRHAGMTKAEVKKEHAFPQKNLSVVIRGPSLHHLDETEIPAIGDDEVLIHVHYIGVCSTDLDILQGNLGYYRSGWAKYPIIPGHEFSGVIASAGKKVAGLLPGDKVVGECILGCGICAQCLADRPINCAQRKEVGVLNYNGAYSRYLKMPARFIHKLPDEAPLHKACLIEPLAVAIRGINKLCSGENGRQKRLVAVLGHGTIGNLCAQLVQSRGHDVIIFDHNPLRIGNLNINGQSRGETNVAGLDRFDYIVEATGNPDVLKKALEESKTGVKILLLGLPYATIDFNFERIVSHDKTILGSVGSSKKEFDQAIVSYLEMDLDCLTDNVFPLSNYEKAWQHHKNGQVIKAILRTDES